MRPGRQASFAIRVPYTICLLRFCRLREIVSPNTHGEVNAFPKTIVPGHSRTPPTRTPTTQFHRPGPKSAGALAAQDVGGARQRRRDQHALPAVRREMPRLASKPTLPGCALPPYAKRRRSLPCGTACPAVRRGPARRTAAAAGRAVRLWSDPDHTVAARRTFPRIRFGIHALLPLHSCLGTRRLSSVGRASHS